MYVQGDELIIKSLFLKDSWTLCYSSSFSILLYYIFSIPPLWRIFYIIYTFLGHLYRTLVYHLNLYSSICLIKHLPYLFVNGSGWDYTVQRSSPHKCGQKSRCSSFNAVVTAFPLDISVFLSSLYVLEVYPHRWRLLEGHPSHPGACLTDIRLVRGVTSSDLSPPLFSYTTIYSGASPVIYSSLDASPLANRA